MQENDKNFLAPFLRCRCYISWIFIVWNKSNRMKQTDYGRRCLRKLYFYFYCQFVVLPQVTEYSFFTGFSVTQFRKLEVDRFSSVNKQQWNISFMIVILLFYWVFCDFATVSDPTLCFSLWKQSFDVELLININFLSKAETISSNISIFLFEVLI